MAGKSWALLLAAPFLILGGLCRPDPAGALTLQCVPRAAIFESLKAADGEVPAHVGVAATGSLFEVLVSPDGTWTAFFTFPDGLTCPVASGDGWRNALPAASSDPKA